MTSPTLNSEDIRMMAQAESWSAPSMGAVISIGHPSEREALRRVAIDRIEKYSGAEALNHFVPVYRDYLKRVDAAILADADRHLEYLHQCIAREAKLFEKAAAQRKHALLSMTAINESIAGYRARIAQIQIAIQLSELPVITREVPASDSNVRGATFESLPLTLCPA